MARTTKQSATSTEETPVEEVVVAPLAPVAEGELYEQWLADITSAGFSQVQVANADFNGIGVFGHDLKHFGTYTKVAPLTLTIVDGRYVIHPVLEVRDLD